MVPALRLQSWTVSVGPTEAGSRYQEGLQVPQELVGQGHLEGLLPRVHW